MKAINVLHVMMFVISFMFFSSSCNKEKNEIRTVSGKITDEASGLPLEGVKLWLVYYYIDESEEKASSNKTKEYICQAFETDAEGNYKVSYNRSINKKRFILKDEFYTYYLKFSIDQDSIYPSNLCMQYPSYRLEKKDEVKDWSIVN